MQEAWNEILFEYGGLIHTPDGDTMFEMQRDIGLLQWHIVYVDNAVILLRHKYVEEVVAELVKIGYEDIIKPEGDPLSDETYQKQLSRITSQCKTNIFDLEQLTDQYNRLQKTSEGKKLTEEDMDKNVVMLSKFMGYRIDKQLTMVSEYAQIFNTYISEMNNLRKVRSPEVNN